MSERTKQKSYRGQDNKRERLKEATHKAVQHTRLLAGGQLRCCCGDPVTTNYYRFDLLDPATGTATGSIIAGEACAQKLIDLSHEAGQPITPLRLFNPFHTPVRDGDGGRGGEGDRIAWAPFNRELFEAINVAFLAMNIPPGSVLSKLLEKIEAAPAGVDVSMAKSLNTIIGKFGGARVTLTQRLNELRVANPTLREYPFVRLRAALAEHRDHPEVYL
jgi:hypothetical protein